MLPVEEEPTEEPLADQSVYTGTTPPDWLFADDKPKEELKPEPQPVAPEPKPEEPKPKPKEMTLEDIEKELGYRVQIVDPEPDKEEVSQDKKEEVNELVDLFNRLFGIDFRDED